MYQQANPNEMPGIGTTIVAVYKPIWKGRGGVQYLPGGGTIDGTNARDPANTFSSGNVPNAQASYANVLEPGLLMGKITASGFYGASVLGLTSAALTTVATTLSVSAAVAAEIVRRIGSSGTLTLVGPPTAGGTVASQTVTFSAVNTSTGAITITATGTAFVTASLVMPTDGSQTIKTFVDEEDGIRVTDINGNGLNIQFPRDPDRRRRGQCREHRQLSVRFGLEGLGQGGIEGSRAVHFRRRPVNREPTTKSPDNLNRGPCGLFRSAPDGRSRSNYPVRSLNLRSR